MSDKDIIKTMKFSNNLICLGCSQWLTLQTKHSGCQSELRAEM